jgi:hypothetical protein
MCVCVCVCVCVRGAQVMLRQETNLVSEDPAGWMLALFAIHHTVPMSVFLLPLSLIVQHLIVDEQRAQLLLTKKSEQVHTCPSLTLSYLCAFACALVCVCAHVTFLCVHMLLFCSVCLSGLSCVVLYCGVL